MANNKVFCKQCKHLCNFAIRARGIYQPDNYRCLKFPKRYEDPLEECKVYDLCSTINAQKDCKGFKQASKLRRFFRN